MHCRSVPHSGVGVWAFEPWGSQVLARVVLTPFVAVCCWSRCRVPGVMRAEPEPQPERQALTAAIEKFKEATALDEAMLALAPDDPAREAMTRDAIATYIAGIQYMSFEWKYCSDASLKQRLGAKLEPYITRVEQLKDLAPAPALPVAAEQTTMDDDGSKLREEFGALLNSWDNLGWSDRSWADVAGLDSAKQSLREVLVRCTSPFRGVLLYGPPGSGKTFLAKVCGKGSLCLSTMPSHRQGYLPLEFVAMLFAEARGDGIFTKQQRNTAMIFLDDFDSWMEASQGASGSRVARHALMSEVHRQMDAAYNKDVVVLAATQKPWLFDEETLRRFPLRVRVTLPDAIARAECARTSVGKTEHELTQADWMEIGERTEGFSGADISVLVREAMMEPIRTIGEATHFKTVSGVDRDGNQRDDMLMACDADDLDPTKVALALTDLTQPQQQRVVEPKMSMEHVRAVLAKSQPSICDEDLAPFAEFEKCWGAPPFSDVLHEGRELCRAHQRLAFALGVLSAEAPPHLAAMPAECVALVCGEVSLSCPRTDHDAAVAAAGCSRQPCQS